jgi:hypothetical protein
MGVGILKLGMVEHLGVAPAAQEPMKLKDKLVWKGFKLLSGASPSLSARLSWDAKNPID